MKKKIIADTSIWIEYFKNNTEIVRIINESLDANEIYIAGPVIAELLQGARNNREREAVSKITDAVPYLDYEMKDWADAGYTSGILKKSGITVPLIDLIIYSVARNNDALIFTKDKHFDLIPDIRLFHSIEQEK